MSDFYDKEGNPITLEEWTKLFEDKSYQVIFQTEHGGVKVSTVWLGLDHNFGGEGPPLIFETMVFGGDHDNHEERYPTLARALEGHSDTCAMAFGWKT